MIELLQKVQRGALLLDEKVPDWYNRINLEKLDMESTYTCVVGQLFEGNYVPGLESLGIDFLEEVNYGFDVFKEFGWSHGWDVAYGQLRDAWIGEINVRYAGASQSGSTTS